jgi:hypothetical protein
MPRPIPPPPPQPSEEETKLAVRWSLSLLLSVFVVFVGLSQCYHSDAELLDYGRTNSMEWNLHKAKNLDMEKRRAHENGQGKIIWLLGSSIVREGFDEKWINQQLGINNSEYRIIKIGTNRGNAGIISGFIKYLDIKKDDIVLHDVPANGFKKDWIEFSAFTTYNLMLVLDKEAFWKLDEWTLADKLEQSSAVPVQFYANHDTYTKGLTRWFTYLSDKKVPPKPKSKHYLLYRKIEVERYTTNPKHKSYIGKNGLDFSAEQFNIQGLQKLEQLCENKQAKLILIHIPPRQEYLAKMMHQKTREQYQTYIKNLEQELYIFPQQAEDDYYDLTHPNFRGRKQLSQYLIDWLQNPQKGEFPLVTWPIPEYNE